MAKAQSPLLGYNTNVKHKGRVFHIQTEDSGIQKPHVITHLFADGGRILKSAKTSYAEHLERPDLAAVVKKLMQDQHKAMFLAVRDGAFESMFEAPETPVVPAAAVVAAPSVVPPALNAAVAAAETQPPVKGSPAPLEDATAMLDDLEAVIEVPETTMRMDAQTIEAAMLSDRASRRPGVGPTVQPVMMPPVPSAPVVAAPVVSGPVAAPTVMGPPPVPREARRSDARRWLNESTLHERTLDEVILAYLAQELEG